MIEGHMRGRRRTYTGYKEDRLGEEGGICRGKERYTASMSNNLAQRAIENKNA